VTRRWIRWAASRPCLICGRGSRRQGGCKGGLPAYGSAVYCSHVASPDGSPAREFLPGVKAWRHEITTREQRVLASTYWAAAEASPAPSEGSGGQGSRVHHLYGNLVTRTRDARLDVLAAVAEHGHRSTRDLACRLGISHTTVRLRIAELVAAGDLIPAGAPDYTEKQRRYRTTGGKARKTQRYVVTDQGMERLRKVNRAPAPYLERLRLHQEAEDVAERLAYFLKQGYSSHDAAMYALGIDPWQDPTQRRAWALDRERHRQAVEAGEVLDDDRTRPVLLETHA